MLHSNKIRIEKDEKIEGFPSIQSNSKDIIFWNVYEDMSPLSMVKIAILGIHRLSKHENQYQILEVEFLLEHDYNNLKSILDNNDILKECFIDLDRGKSFTYPIIQANYSENDEYTFCLVEN